jgi:hypothetical protein
LQFVPKTKVNTMIESNAAPLELAETTEPMSEYDKFGIGADHGVDREAMVRILESLRYRRDAMIEERPLEALALSIVVEAAGNVIRSALVSDRVRRENCETARRKAALERHKLSDGFFRKVLKEPGIALAEARLHFECRSRVIELWRCLGRSLARFEGWNSEELKLAFALCGSTDAAVLTSRESVKLDRALRLDRQRPEKNRSEVVEKVMKGYIDRLIATLERISPDHAELHRFVIASVQEKSLELMDLIGVEDRDAIDKLKASETDRHAARRRWASVRAFVAARIREWRVGNRAFEKVDTGHGQTAAAESIGLAEMRKADWARKATSAAIADFQKSLALGKSIGLPDLMNPKPPKASRTSDGQGTMSVCSIATAMADAVFSDTTVKVKPRRGRKLADRNPGKPICSIPRDSLGRFLPGFICTQPRDAKDRFVKAGDVGEIGCGKGSRFEPAVEKVCRGLRATSEGMRLLGEASKNVEHRDRANRAGDSVNEPGETNGVIWLQQGSGAGYAIGAGLSVLADFDETVQNGDTRRCTGDGNGTGPISENSQEPERDAEGDDER